MDCGQSDTLDNTLICFLSDNGGCAEELGRQMKALHVPKKTRDGAAMVAGNAPEKMPGPGDTYQSYGIGWENEGNSAVREGNYKLVSKYPGGWELYDLDQDRTELQDLASAQPAVVKRWASKHDAWAKQVGAEAWTTVQAAPKIRRLLE